MGIGKKLVKTCTRCDISFETHKKTTRFCSAKCNNAFLYINRDKDKYNSRKRINNMNSNTRVRHFYRYKNDSNYRISCVLRARFRAAIKDNTKNGSAVKDLGCSLHEFKQYIESKFQPGMTWDNWSRNGWHIDHIKPLSLFDLTDPEQLKQACHYTNLQPLWAKDNILKSNKVDS